MRVCLCRRQAAFAEHEFERAVAKFVRPGHIQTDDRCGRGVRNSALLLLHRAWVFMCAAAAAVTAAVATAVTVTVAVCARAQLAAQVEKGSAALEGNLPQAPGVVCASPFPSLYRLPLHPPQQKRPSASHGAHTHKGGAACACCCAGLGVRVVTADPLRTRGSGRTGTCPTSAPRTPSPPARARGGERGGGTTPTTGSRRCLRRL